MVRWHSNNASKILLETIKKTLRGPGNKDSLEDQSDDSKHPSSKQQVVKQQQRFPNFIFANIGSFCKISTLKEILLLNNEV